MKIEKRALTLIEVCIAFGIIAVCFYVVFSNFNISSKLIAKTEKARIVSMQKQFLCERLTYIFEHLEAGSLGIEEKKIDDNTVFFLSFVFENGLDREMIFSGKRRGEIELNNLGELTLSIFSKQGDKTRTEILIAQLKDVTWSLDTTAVVRLTTKDLEEHDLNYAFLLPRGNDDVIVIEETS